MKKLAIIKATFNHVRIGTSLLVFLLMFTLLAASVFAQQENTAVSPKIKMGVNQLSGALENTYPLDIPEFHGLEPLLALNYSSSGPNGWLGVGWSLSGVSYIERGTKGKGAPRFDANDVFFVDGMELIPDTSLGGTHSTKYQTYKRIVKDSSANKWYMWDKNGTKYSYDPYFQTTYGTYRWVLSQVTDTLGNTVFYHYWTDSSKDTYLDRIEYNGNVIKFYSEVRTDVIRYAVGAGLAQMEKRLKTIDVKVGSSRKKAYKLDYTTSAATGRSCLSAIKEYGKDAVVDTAGNVTSGTMNNPVTFTTRSVNDGLTSGTWMNETDPSLLQSSLTNFEYKTIEGDFNGDGTGDLLSIDPGSKAYLELSRLCDQGYRSMETTHTYTGTTIYTNNHLNVALTNGNKSEDFTFLPGDYNGDGKTDLATISATGIGGWRDWIAVEISNADANGQNHSFSSYAWNAMTPVHMHNVYEQMHKFRVITGDFNGDGKTDIVTVRRGATTADWWSNNISVEISTGSGFSSQAWSSALAMNVFNGGGDVNDYNIIPADVNGDGKTDIVALKRGPNSTDWWSNYVSVEISTGSGFVSQTWSSKTPVHMFNGGGTNRDYKTVAADLNGDGKTDLATFSATAGGGWADWIAVELSTGNSFISEIWASTAQKHMRNVQGKTWEFQAMPCDMNEDGLTDIAFAYKYHALYGNGWHDNMYLEISKSNGFTSTNWNWGESPFDFYGTRDVNMGMEYQFYPTRSGLEGRNSFLMKKTYYDAPQLSGTFSTNYGLNGIRGNGNRIEFKLDDVWYPIYFGRSNSNITITGGMEFSRSVITAVRCSGNTITFDVRGKGSVVLTLQNAYATGEIKFADLRDTVVINVTGKGNGLFFSYLDNGYWDNPWVSLPPIQISTTKTAKTLSCNMSVSNRDVPDLIATVNNGLGITTNITYCTTQFKENRILPENCVITTVSSLIGSDLKFYNYFSPKWDYQDHFFIGFGKVQEILDIALYGTTETVFHQDHPAKYGKPLSVRVSSGQFANVLYSCETYAYSHSMSPPYFCNNTEKNREDYGDAGSVRKIRATYTYDGYGNTVKAIEYGDTAITGDERTTTWGYYPNTSAYIVGLPGYENVLKGIDGTNVVKQTLYVYDANTGYTQAPAKGLLTQEKRWNNQTNTHLVEKLEYDSYGNLVKSINPMNGTAEFTYDPTYHVYMLTEKNALGQTKSFQWDYVLGKSTVETDLNSKQKIRSYNALGMLTQITYPNGGTEKYTYYNFNNSNSSKYIRRELSDGTSDGLWKESYIDGLGRPYQFIEEGGAKQELLYYRNTLIKGKETQWYKPGETAKNTWVQFDAIGRVTGYTYPGNINTQIQYNPGLGMVCEINELGVKKETFYDAYGRTIRVKEYNGTNVYTTSYEYDVLGNPTKVTDAENNVYSVVWDSLGRKLSQTDPDTGTVTYTYNDAGSIASSNDANNQNVTFQYDALQRLKKKNYPDGTSITWNYDETATTNGKGRLTSINFPGGSYKINSYSSTGKILSETRTVDSTSCTFEYTYDSLDRLKTIKYPDAEVVTYNYDAEGNLNNVPNYITSMTYAPDGRLITITNANGTTENYTYDANRLWLKTAQVKKGISLLYDAGYGYDVAGRVTSVTSTTNPLMNVTYSYDDLDRLISVSGAQSQTLQYSPGGNILSNSALGAIYAYGDANHKHAVTSTGSYVYTYDNNGNMLGGKGRTYTWTYENLVKTVTYNGQTTNYVYDHEGERVKKSNSSGTVYYFSKLYEKDATGTTKYIYADGRMVAMKKQNGEKYWYHQDRLGSVKLITDASGNTAKKYDYAAYGKVAGTSGTLTDYRQFTGHMTDPETGLIYMNSRYYDPDIARFISADSIIPESNGNKNPQALNRYSYCFNNPVLCFLRGANENIVNSNKSV